MNIIGNPGVDKANFELWSFAVSSINGCSHCMVAHEHALREAGVDREAILEALKVAAIVVRGRAGDQHCPNPGRRRLDTARRLPLCGLERSRSASICVAASNLPASRSTTDTARSARSWSVANGQILDEDHNRVTDNDQTLHAELGIIRWAVANMAPVHRIRATVYTSCEPCPMCAGAHAWAGLGRIVYATSCAQLTCWLTEWQAADTPVAMLPVTTVVPRAVVDGPAPDFEAEMKSLYETGIAGERTVLGPST